MLDLKELDEKVIPMVKFFNDIGLKTMFSCQGHDNINSNFYIIFDDEVKDKDVANFLIRCREKGKIAFRGKFCNWMRPCKGEIKCNWMFQLESGNCTLNQALANRELLDFVGCFVEELSVNDNAGC